MQKDYNNWKEIFSKIDEDFKQSVFNQEPTANWGIFDVFKKWIRKGKKLFRL